MYYVNTLKEHNFIQIWTKTFGKLDWSNSQLHQEINEDRSNSTKKKYMVNLFVVVLNILNFVLIT